MNGIRFDGLATGLDTTALVRALLDQERQPLVLVEQRQSQIAARQSLFRTLNTHLLALADAAKALDNQNSSLTGPTLDEELLEYGATSSDEQYVVATAAGDASPGSHSVRVDALAQTGRRISQGFASDTDIVAQAGESIQIDFGGAAPIDVTVDPGGASLTQLADAINTHADNGGMVRADVIFDGSAHRLILAGTQTGVANDLSVTTDISGPGGTGPLLDAALTQNASDARIQVLGLTVTRPSNSISDVIPGVTLELRSAHDPADPLAAATIEVSRDDSAIESKIQTVVDAFNVVRDFATQQSQYDETSGKAGLLSGDITVRSIERQLQTTIGSAFSFAGNSLTSLGQIGVTFDRDGRLELDSEKLREALDDDALAVRQLLSGDGITDGVVTALARQLEPITRSGDGTLAIRDDGFDDRIEALDQTIERMERRLEQREELLIQQFSRLEGLISSLQAQGDYLLSAITQGQGGR